MGITIRQVRHSWPEREGFVLERKRGAGEYILLHFHTSVKLRVGESEYETNSGTFVVIRPHTYHRMECHAMLSHDWMHITGDVEQLMATFGLKCDVPYEAQSPDVITMLVEQLERAFLHKAKYFSELAVSLLSAVFILIANDRELRQTPGEEFTASVGAQSTAAVREKRLAKVHMDQKVILKLKDIHDMMIMYPEREWSVKRIAEFVGMSSSRLYPVYNEVFGMTPNQDLISIRVERAKCMLKQGIPVAAVAERCGYTNVYHFIRQFKKITGYTPKAYR